MANQLGRLMIIQYRDTPTTWANLCGVNTTTLAITNAVNSEEKVNCDNRDQLVETLKEYGAQDIKFDTQGLFEDGAAGTYAADKAIAQEKVELRVFVPGWGYIENPEWLISNVNWNGAATGNLQHSASFEASGASTFTAV